MAVFWINHFSPIDSEHRFCIPKERSGYFRRQQVCGYVSVGIPAHHFSDRTQSGNEHVWAIAQAFGIYRICVKSFTKTPVTYQAGQDLNSALSLHLNPYFAYASSEDIWTDST